MTKYEVALLAAESYKQALIDTQKVINEMFDASFSIYEKNIIELKRKISNPEA